MIFVITNVSHSGHKPSIWWWSNKVTRHCILYVFLFVCLKSQPLLCCSFFQRDYYQDSDVLKVLDMELLTIVNLLSQNGTRWQSVVHQARKNTFKKKKKITYAVKN